MQSNSIFRQVALERLSSPEQLDQIVQVTNPKSWLALLAIGALLVTAVTWGIIGRIPVEVSGSAILLNSGGVNNIISVQTGQIATLVFGSRAAGGTGTVDCRNHSSGDGRGGSCL